MKKRKLVFINLKIIKKKFYTNSGKFKFEKKIK